MAMGECNYCTLRRIKRKAKEDGAIVTTKAGLMGGIDVLVHSPDEKADQVKHFVYWLTAVPKGCEC